MINISNMKKFLDEDFLLSNETARILYHDYAKQMPIIDYHCHLPQQQIAENKNFENITQAWLYGDHYKWRAMRANGVDEQFCTGSASDAAKLQQWAATVPYTLRNPLYHWTHLELQRYFDMHDILNPNSATAIYDACSEKLRSPEYSTKNLIRKMNVATICTTDDPADDLAYHLQLKNDGFEVPVLPAFRPDNAMEVSNPARFNAYVGKLEKVSDTVISTHKDFLDVLKKRHDFFASVGCSVSDHGLEQLYAEDFTETEIAQYFLTIRSGKELNELEQKKFKSAMLLYFAELDWEKGWIQQFHLGALRNNNTRRLRDLGPDTGWDSIGDFGQGRALSAFLGRLDDQNKLAKTILYNLNPADNELIATMAGNFNDGSIKGKIQFGSGWWFLDQKDGMTKQLNALSNMGLISRFVGMLTDSRSFLSYPRHEYFRRIVCNLFGTEIENGEMPADLPWVGKIIQDISYRNAREYFNWKSLKDK